MELDRVPGCALEFTRVFKDDETFPWIAEDHHLVNERVRERGLAGGRSAGDHDVLSCRDRVTKGFRVPGLHDSSRDVVFEGVDQPRALANHEDRRHGNRWQDPLEAVAVERKLSL